MISKDEQDSLINAIKLPNSKFMGIIISLLEKYDDLLSYNDIELFVDKESSRKNFGHDYPILVEVDPSKDKKEQIFISGQYRYYSDKKCCIKGKEYYYTSQLYGLGQKKSHSDNRIELWKWVCNLLSVNISGKDFKEPTEVGKKECIEKIKKYIASKEFSYKDGLIENFYLCLKSKPFVILAGISGTGKSKLVELFAEACGATDDNGRFLLVPVKPDWSDSSDLLGHVNLNGKFVEGSIIKFIKKAEKDPKKPYFLCLDEMNLARVEYYFSDFLSVIETRKIMPDSTIKTKALISPESCADKSKEYGGLQIPDNLYVVGTVNMDETTFPFSKKVLDRANTIEFSSVNLIPDDDKEENIVKPIDVENDFLKTTYIQLPNENDNKEFVLQICKELEKINKILAISNSQIAYRVRDELVSYCVENKKADLLPENVAMDNEIMQKILPRLQGSSLSMKKTLCKMFEYCATSFDGGDDISKGDIAESMNKALKKEIKDDSCRFPLSAAKLVEMVRRFEEDGFTTYWL